uniref:Dynein light chain Tctex-type 2B n=1 Tax=Equus asinus TaxID=9793 RepID=A0A8C4LBU3_EQUAS
MAAPRDASFSAGVSFSVADSLPETEKNAAESENTYILRPIFQQRFRPSVVKDCIHAVLKEELANAEYSPEETPQLTKHLSESIKDKLKEMGFDRYKMVVQVVIGEQRGEGVFMAARCFWDADTDNYTHDVFMNFPTGAGPVAEWLSSRAPLQAAQCFVGSNPGRGHDTAHQTTLRQ